MSSNQYEIGYGKPPKDYQFKTGESGNNKGRPRGSKNTYTILNEILSQKIAIKENGETMRISKKAAMLIQLVNKGVKGNIRAIQTLLPHLLFADMREEEKEKILSALNRNDRAIIDSFLSNLDGLEIIAEDENCEDDDL
ncbi:MAG: DUF5681 domain-containing protein [Candidatus Eremiobacteraeota bacterium]|nr:DUF5681 domain-containing protein [Candidatus Eremiobacteraeota bacterium]